MDLEAILRIAPRLRCVIPTEREPIFDVEARNLINHGRAGLDTAGSIAVLFVLNLVDRMVG